MSDTANERFVSPYEECDETGQRISKAQQFGLAEIQSDQPSTNAKCMTPEVGDTLITVFNLLGRI